MKYSNIPIFIPQLGCPRQCIFCNQRKISSFPVSPEPADIESMINTHLGTLGDLAHQVEVAFFGGSFTALPQERQNAFLDIVQPFVLDKRVAGLRISTRPDALDEQILYNLKQRNVRTIELGVQSFSARVLEKAQRGYDPGQAVEACRLVKAWGFKLGIQLMQGLPGADWEQDLQSAYEAAKLEPDMVRLYPTVVIKDTPLEETYKLNQYTPLSLEEARNLCAQIALIMYKKNIKIIRMGLYPGKELLDSGNIIAGPFHPAFGELVEQRIFLEQISYGLAKLLGSRRYYSGRVSITVNGRDLSKMTGRKRENMVILKNRWPVMDFNITTSVQLNRNDILITVENFPDLLCRRADFLLDCQNDEAGGL